MQINRHLSELWKKEKGVHFYETLCTCINGIASKSYCQSLLSGERSTKWGSIFYCRVPKPYSNLKCMLVWTMLLRSKKILRFLLQPVWYYRTAPWNVSPGGSVGYRYRVSHRRFCTGTKSPRINLARYRAYYRFSPVIIDSPPPLQTLSPHDKVSPSIRY